ncbi:type IV pilus modification protein PilV [Lysobacter sp. KIS68-7]|uniref:type IV pilus modification protein PilV n=1 Tax=Lysobacter sp. KIS68-7 TaxID=2904252 RepID=UPI001E5F0D4F|nr:type IV pilus modification protein PilV [Lysobacter sp. KIS68-7]UHQ19278.1 type IV pilus modification protein PilV [Lysobacter sp. KIS68-7]
MKTPRIPASSQRRQRGVGLVEVLVAVVVLAFGLLGIAAMQLTSLRNSQSALERSQAVAQTYAILDAMRANRPVAMIGGYNINKTCTLPDPGNLVANDLRHWLITMQDPQILGPNTCGQITCGTASCRIQVWWDNSRSKGGSAQELVTTNTLL